MKEDFEIQFELLRFCKILRMGVKAVATITPQHTKGQFTQHDGWKVVAVWPALMNTAIKSKQKSYREQLLKNSSHDSLAN